MLHARALILTILSIFASVIPIPAAHAEACRHSPAPIIAAGDAVVVAPGMNGLNLRALPAVGTGRVAALNQGYPLTVIGGPSCNGMYTWWRVETPTGVSGWVAGGTWTTYYLIPAVLPPEGEAPPTPFDWTCRMHFDAARCG
ncbi:MAG: SH3 domain-containing protein [Anaerolineae bacterium]|nr:SH3 domain-containing protein [Anaerolineae bacterium]NUQ06734.1 SH3 domain-containing protein [Anaerolineae bacterium]